MPPLPPTVGFREHSFGPGSRDTWVIGEKELEALDCMLGDRYLPFLENMN